MSLRSTSAIYQNFTINNFTVKEQLGSGKFGIVYRAIEKYSEKEVAIKIILKKTITSSTLHKQLQREIQIQSRLKHSSICELYAYFHDAHSIYIVLQYCPHGNLSIPVKNNREYFSDKKIASIFLQLCQAVAYMHQRNVMHRDLKLQNILLDDDYNVKISDFGWCIHQANQRLTFCGTMEYISPEMIKKEKYSHSIDVYCLGIILYELFYFVSPFLGQDQNHTFKLITQSDLKFDDSIRVIPDEAKDLLRQLLNKDPTSRPKANSLLENSFVKRYLLQSEQFSKLKKERITEQEYNKWRLSLKENINDDINEQPNFQQSSKDIHKNEAKITENVNFSA